MRAIGCVVYPATEIAEPGVIRHLDGNRFTLELYDTRIRDSVANEGGGSIFFVSNDRSGHLTITDSTLSGNVSLGFETSGLPGIFYLGNGPARIVDSTLG